MAEMPPLRAAWKSLFSDDVESMISCRRGLSSIKTPVIFEKWPSLDTAIFGPQKLTFTKGDSLQRV